MISLSVTCGQEKGCRGGAVNSDAQPLLDRRPGHWGTWWPGRPRGDGGARARTVAATSLPHGVRPGTKLVSAYNIPSSPRVNEVQPK